jgi:hypothetical protein
VSSEIRLIVKQYRFGLVGFGLILGTIAVALAVLAAYFSTLDLGRCQDASTPECMAALLSAGRLGVVAIMLQGMASPIVVFAGVFLGASIIATEIERGTAVIAWTVGGSRARWLAPRVLVVGLVLLAAATAIGIALDAVQQTIDPRIPLTASLNDYETRGWLIPARAIAAFGAGLFAGAVLGRALPALLAGVVISAVAVAGVLGLGAMWDAGGAHPVGFNDGSIVNQLVLRDQTTGEYIDYASAEALIPQSDPRFVGRFTEVPLGVPGTSAPMVVGRESAALVVVSIALVAGSFVVANRRRPY